MSRLFRRNSSVNCFFCQSPCALSSNPRSFCCPTCRCWNRYDERGEIISEEPAMYIESLNADSFAKRASTSRDQFPSVHGARLFCHTCQSNQLLLMNLLSNYLPSPSDPEYAMRLAMLPEYRESLYARYPPACESCLPAVEDDIRRKDNMARTKALGGWLNDSKKNEQQRRVSEASKEPGKLTVGTLIWRIRGVLWATTLATAVVCDLAGALGVRLVSFPDVIRPLLPAIVLLSSFWTFWDPTYLSYRRALRQGSHVRVRGKRSYINLQMVAWFLRFFTSSLVALTWYGLGWVYPVISHIQNRVFFTSCLLLELTIFTSSYIVLRIHQPPAVRLVNTNLHMPLSPIITPQLSTRSSTPVIGLGRPSAAPEPDLLAALSLSSKPVISGKPVFGMPSLPSAGSSPLAATQESDTDAMDWVPTTKSKVQELDDGLWLRPQRFFAPEQPTGLEGLFEQTLFVADDTPSFMDEGQSRNLMFRGWRYLRRRWLAYLLFIVPIGGVVYKLHDAWRNVPRPISRPHALLT